ncbi:YybH family protein [Nostoc sphaeroides]|uniref:SnoaL-like domain-containing protein n=1 Tax=Nostoc sphaeroides CCNUC1 TaxID=2653204 RepID=A0A5P8WI88_9NOSO|nr:nuclear transport factor 2 family protein [Nostoc sphaeroides]QFS52518.1 hypothetical protein GXM_10273 [Nostoc sphaeroides CCNUC1]
MKRILKSTIVFLCVLFFAIPAHALSEKFTPVNQVENSLTIAVVNTNNATINSAEQQQKIDEEAIREILLGKWRNLWSTGDKKFTFQGYEKVFLDNEDFMATDSLSPSATLVKGWKAYSELWEPYTNQHLHPWTITRLEVNKISVAGDMAWSSVNLYGEGILDGENYLGSEHCTHVWRKIDGQWRIVHEHVSGPIYL